MQKLYSNINNLQTCVNCEVSSIKEFMKLRSLCMNGGTRDRVYYVSRMADFS